MKGLIFSITVICIIAMTLSGCGKKDNFEPTRYQSQEGLARMTQEQSDKMAKKVTPTSPRFLAAANIALVSEEVKDLDAVIKPVLKKLFGDAKIISESKAPETQRDGEVVENRFTYMVGQILNSQNGVALHSALHAAGFGLSPRLGSKPTTWSGGVTMSLFKTTSRRSYSLVINVDTKKQQIVVESYKLGSKYDRLM